MSTEPGDRSPARVGAGHATTLGGEACPVCYGSSVTQRIDLGSYGLYECTRCGCWSSDAALREATTTFEPRDYFENAAADRSRWIDLLDRVSAMKKPLRRVLDVGCGNGAFLEFLGETRRDVELEGIEFDPTRASGARERNPEATVHTGDALENASRLQAGFDLITLWDVFEHVPEPTRLLSSLAQRLSKEGAIYLQTIHEQSLLPTLGRMSYRWSGGRFHYGVKRTHEAHHLVFFSREGLEAAASEANLRVRETWFDRLAHARMDGPVLVTRLTAMILAMENAWGNGLFINAILEPR